MKNYVNDGTTLPWTNGGTAKTSGAVVAIKHTLGVLSADVGSGETGTVRIEGTFTVPKVSGAVFAQGEKLIWDASAGAFDDSSATPASGDITGGAIAVLAGADGETSCTVKLTPGNTTLTA